VKEGILSRTGVFLNSLVVLLGIVIGILSNQFEIPAQIKPYAGWLTVGLVLVLLLAVNLYEWIRHRDESKSTPPPTPEEVNGEDQNNPFDTYLQQVVDKVGWLNLSGVDPTLAADAKRRRLALPAVYVNLETLKAGGQRGLVVEQMGREARLVLLGDPGSGKSTFVNFVALCLAGDRLNDEKANLGKLGERWKRGWFLPVRVILREFVVRGLPPIGQEATSKDLLRFLEEEVGAAFAPMLREYLQGRKKNKRAMLLLDGFDEVPEANERRQQVMDVVMDLVKTYPNCRFLLTSRTYAWERQAWQLDGFAEARLEPFSEQQIDTFIDGWYEQVGALNLGVSSGQVQTRAAMLKQAISNSPRLHELATRPLLLTLMTSLHAWRGGDLPEKREKLYENAVELLLHIWERHRVVHDGNGAAQEQAVRDWLKIEPDKLLYALEEIAYKAHAGEFMAAGSSNADIPEKELADALWKIRGAESDLNPKQIIRYIQDRAGLLLPVGHGVYQFPHRSFQEYLAARYLTNNKMAQEIADLMMTAPERWQEVVLLAIAKAARGFKDSAWVLVDALAPTDPPNDPAKNLAWAAYVAAIAITENDLYHNLPPLYQEKVRRLKGWLVVTLQKSLLPPVQRANAGYALACLGESRPDVIAFPPATHVTDSSGKRRVSSEHLPHYQCPICRIYACHRRKTEVLGQSTPECGQSTRCRRHVSASRRLL